MNSILSFATRLAIILIVSGCVSSSLNYSPQEIVTDSIAQYSSNVVSIQSRRTPDSDLFYKLGSGTLFKKVSEDNLYVVTNEHVTRGQDPKGNIRIFFPPNDGITHGCYVMPANITIMGQDSLFDISVLRIKENSTCADKMYRVKAYSLEQDSTPNYPEPGEPAFVIGYPGDMGHTVTSGIVSSVNHRIVRTDAIANKGNSGGPLVRPDGTIVGIVRSIDSSSPGGEFDYTDAIPIKIVKYIANELIERREVSRGHVPIKVDLESCATLYMAHRRPKPGEQPTNLDHTDCVGVIVTEDYTNVHDGPPIGEGHVITHLDKQRVFNVSDWVSVSSLVLIDTELEIWHYDPSDLSEKPPGRPLSLKESVLNIGED